jgi:hypothetical protein
MSIVLVCVFVLFVAASFVVWKAMKPPDHWLELEAAIVEVGPNGIERIVEWVPVERVEQ